MSAKRGTFEDRPEWRDEKIDLCVDCTVELKSQKHVMSMEQPSLRGHRMGYDGVIDSIYSRL